jgi:hypothetical protein
MLEYFNDRAQPVAGKVDISDHSVVTPDGATPPARWYRQPSSDLRAGMAGPASDEYAQVTAPCG